MEVEVKSQKRLCFALCLCAPIGPLASAAIAQDLPTCTSTDKLVKTITVGGDGGDAWDESGNVIYGPITQIEVWAADVVDAIRVKYGNTYGNKHGGGGGEYHVFSFKPEEKITLASGRAGDNVDWICFATTSNPSATCYGGGGGDDFQASEPGTMLVALSGRSGKFTDGLNFEFGRQWRAQDGSFRYSNDALQKAVSTAPKEQDSQIFTNDSDLPQSFTCSKTLAETAISRAEWRDEQSNKWTVGFEVQFKKKGVPIQAKLSFSYERYEMSSHGVSTENQSGSTKAWTYPVQVPPHSEVTATASWYNVPLNLNVKYRAIYFRLDGEGNEVDVCQEDHSTTFEGIASTNVDIQVAQIALKP
jgi:hypothetical protein